MNKTHYLLIKETVSRENYSVLPYALVANNGKRTSFKFLRSYV